MRNFFLNVLSGTFIAAASACFIGGVAVLARGGV